MRWCSNPKCIRKAPQRLSDFPKHPKGPQGLHSQCKLCVGRYQKSWRQKNQTYKATQDRQYRVHNVAAVALVNRIWRLRTKYGLTIKDHQTLLKSQNFRCAICFYKFQSAEQAQVDHQHLK